ncbi:YeeE/YedE family protein [Vibrio sp. Of7-15]|uniref:YeeE/YedE family protein n=1 Tax=Vibrio sp. Of7-15 TaxID=2724879 RepID=UPI001EF36CC9|nr:YeeE/YedE family protein [Vibrio sp. Of7-15]MCG7496673.1 YeeE/YedE family protein [Vibrio sp. Of7-15]
MFEKTSSLIAGLLFGFGMVLSGMVDPEKVIGFLDVTGQWDISLLFVMGGALAVFMPSYFLLIKPRNQPIATPSFSLSTIKKVDASLISGAAIFGTGWGILGICPGPALASITTGDVSIVVFIASMFIGFGIVNYVRSYRLFNPAPQ